MNSPITADTEEHISISWSQESESDRVPRDIYDGAADDDPCETSEEGHMSLAGMKLLEEMVSQARLEVEFMEGLSSSQSSFYSPAEEDSTRDDGAEAAEPATNTSDCSTNSNDDSRMDLTADIGSDEGTSEGAAKAIFAENQEGLDDENA